jgi:hypothetical protein
VNPGFLSYAEEKDESFPAHTSYEGARVLGVVAVFGPIGRFGLSSGARQPAAAKSIVTVVTSEDARCLSCHSEVRPLRLDGKHQGLPGLTCRTQVTEHWSDARPKPSTNFDLTACGSCHQDQYMSFLKRPPASGARIEKAGPNDHDPHAAKPRGGQATGKRETDGA